MAKSKYKIEIESWIVFVIAVIVFVVTLLNKFIPKLNIMSLFVAPTNAYGEFPFSFSNPLSYLRIFIHIFGSFSLVSMSCYLCLITFVPNAERDFGTIPVIVMIALSAFFSGVLSACFCKNAVSGVEPIVYLLIFLNIFGGLQKKKIPVLQLLILVMFITCSIAMPENPDIITVLVQIAGGLCGSLVSFLTVPKTKKTTKKSKEAKLEPAPLVLYDNEADSPRFKNKNNPENTTEVGTLKL